MNQILKKVTGLILIIVFLGIGILNLMKRNNWLDHDYSDYTIHISIDDTIDLFSDLTENEDNYKSAFENPTLKFCKNMHDKYGAIFSFYVFEVWNGFELKDCTKKFREEFEENSDWLKFNFHAYDSKENLNDIDCSVFKKEYELTMNSLANIVGENAIDKATRLSGFSGNKDVLEYISKDSTVFYTADDTRNSYYFDDETSKIIYENEIYFDNGLEFIKTDLRLDNTEYPYHSMIDLVRNSNDKRIEVFTHEWLLQHGSFKSQSIWKIREVCRFAHYYKLRFEYD